MRASPLLSCAIAIAAVATLTACAGGNSAADLAPQQAEAPSPEPMPAAPARAAPAGRVQSAPIQAPPPPARQAAATPEEIKAQCWMKYEGDKKIKNIDARLQLVEKCIDETSRNQPPPPRQ